MTHLTDDIDQLSDRRSGEDRRRIDDPSAARAAAEHDPIAAWPLVIPDHILGVRCPDPWSQVVHRSLLAEHDGEHEEAGRAWDERVVWQLSGPDPTAAEPAHAGAAGIVAYHRELGRLTDYTFRQELSTIESGRGPIVEAHLRTTAQRNGRRLESPTLLIFELSSLRVRRVTEIPGDLVAWTAFWER